MDWSDVYLKLPNYMVNLAPISPHVTNVESDNNAATLQLPQDDAIIQHFFNRQSFISSIVQETVKCEHATYPAKHSTAHAAIHPYPKTDSHARL